MTVHAGSLAIQKIERAADQIRTLLGQAETAINSVAAGFEDLAEQTGMVLEPVASIVSCVEDESFRSVVSKVDSLGITAKEFVRRRLEAAGGMLETVTAEARLLERLSELTRGQRSIARETQTLSVLTNIEVARLGQLGAGFQYLAHELDDFSKAVAESTKELTNHTDERKSSVNETKRMLAAGLPRIRSEFARIEEDLSNVLAEVRSSSHQLEHAPAMFRAGVEEIAGQIAGVVSAIQSHDITRQQLEHVQEGLELLLSRMTAEEDTASEESDQHPVISAGLTVQTYQLRSIEETVNQWVEQIGACLDSILRISSSELATIGPLVMKQENTLTAQLARIGELEQDCQKENKEVQSTFTGLSSLMQLVSEHVEKSRYVRDRLQLLTFNSIVEANHLGSQADAILEISQSIKRISLTWSDMTDRSAQAMTEILELVEGAKEKMEAFSIGGNEALSAAQSETRLALDSLRTTASCVVCHTAAVEENTARLQTKIAVADAARSGLAASFSAIAFALEGMGEARTQIENEFPNAIKQINRRELEALFSGSYTTEWEREVMRAALSGAPLPSSQQNLAGNSVELF